MTRAWRNRPEVRQWFFDGREVEAEAHRRWFESYSKRIDDEIYIVEFAGVPVGQASIYHVDDRIGAAEVGRFIAAPAMEGKGFMSDALRLLIDIARNRGLRTLYLHVKPENSRGISLYQRCGFQMVDEASDDDCRMELRL
jgi:RimJ/RimL family protein N-acetyltransferase